MAEFSPVDSIDEVLAAVREANRALKRAPPGETADEARRRSCERVEQQERLKVASRTNTSAAPRMNGSSGHAPATGGNGAQPVQGEATSLSDDLTAALAKGTVAFVKATIAPLKERIAELERPRLEGAGAFKAEWICKEPNSDDTGRSCEECGSRGPRMRSGPTLLNAVWMAIAKRPDEFLCSECVLQRCRERLGRELNGNDLRGCDSNGPWLAIGGTRRHE